MKHLFGNLKEFEDKISSRSVFLFLDYDGTLTPIVKTPDRARISKTNRNLLNKLSKKKDLKLAVISGRELADVKRHVGVRGIIYSGNHGFEMKGARPKFKSPITKNILASIKDIYKKLKKDLDSIRGCIIEDKKYSISVHYRLAAKSSVTKIRGVVFKAVGRHIKNKKVKVKPGKKVWEIKPALNWHKGKIVSWLIKNETDKHVLPIYVGDDVTDNDAFKALGKNGISIYVGNDSRLFDAKYRLKNTKEVTRFLSLLGKITD